MSSRAAEAVIFDLDGTLVDTMVEAALARLGSDPRRSIMVGDTPYDGQACVHAGVTVLGLLCAGQPPERLVEAGAQALYLDPADLLLHLDEALRLPASAVP